MKWKQKGGMEPLYPIYPDVQPYQEPQVPRKKPSRPVLILGLIAAAELILLIALVVLCLPYFEKEPEQPQSAAQLEYLEETQPEETVPDATVPEEEETEQEEPVNPFACTALTLSRTDITLDERGGYFFLTVLPHRALIQISQATHKEHRWLSEMVTAV